MKTRRGIFAVVVDEKNNLLVLHRVLNWKGWEVLKGGIDESNSEKTALMKELREETGLQAKDILSARPTKTFLTYNYPRWYQKKWKEKSAKFRGWVVRLKSEKKKKGAKKRISFANNPEREHDRYKWMPLAKALKILSFVNQRAAVKAVLKQFNLGH